jgi:hypothetical protein
MKLRLTILFGTLVMVCSAMSSAIHAQDAEDLARQEAAAERARQIQAAREVAQDKARQEWNDRQRQQSENNLELAIRRAAEAKRVENETKFRELQSTTAKLLAVSQRLNSQVNASGSQAISVTFYSDLDQIEKLVKRIRAAGK